MKVKKKDVANASKKKPKVLLFALALLFIVLLILAIVFFVLKRNKESEVVQYYETADYVVSTFTDVLHTHDLDSVGLSLESPYLVNNLKLFNNNDYIESLFYFVLDNTNLSSSTTERLTGDTCTFNVSISSIDFESIAKSLDADIISQICLSIGLDGTESNISTYMPEIAYTYLSTMDDIPLAVTSSDVSFVDIGVGDKEDKGYISQYVLSSDKFIDELVFSSDSFHGFQDSIAKVVVGWDDTSEVSTTVIEVQDNPEYTDWLSLLNSALEKYPVWEDVDDCLYIPVYIEDSDVVDYYILLSHNEDGVRVKEDNDIGYAYIPMPSETIEVEVPKSEVVSNVWDASIYFPYTCLGYSYVEDNALLIPVGDGTETNPASVGTLVYGSLLSIDNIKVDASFKLLNVYTGKEAVEYAVSVSDKNRGLDSNSVVKLAICLVEVTNLSDSIITFHPDLCLVNDFGSKASRTGTLYGLADSYTLDVGESCTVVDWVSSTSLEQSMVVWGNSFSVNIPYIYFKTDW